MAENSINFRVKFIRETLGLSQREFCKQLLISQPLCNAIENNARKVSMRTIRLISKNFFVNMDYLTSGKLPIFNEQPQDSETLKLLEIFKQLNKPLRRLLIEQGKLLLKMQNQKEE